MLVSPHSIAYDSSGNIYVGDVVETDWHHLYANQPMPKHMKRFHRFANISIWKNDKKTFWNNKLDIIRIKYEKTFDSLFNCYIVQY